MRKHVFRVSGAVHPQKMATDLKFRIKVEELYYLFIRKR